MIDNVVVVAGGVFCDYQKKLFLQLSKTLKNKIIIACDSGANYLAKLNTIPDFVIGDLDSITKRNLKLLQNRKVVIKKYPKDKDKSDLELGLMEATKLSPKNIFLFSCLGERQDYTYGNLNLLANLTKKFKSINFCIISSSGIIKSLNANTSYTLRLPINTNISLLSVSTKTSSIVLSGVKWQLNKKSLLFGSCKGISNQVKKNRVKISFQKGILLLFIMKQLSAKQILGV